MHIRLTLASGQSIVVPVDEIMDEDRMFGSDGRCPTDPLHVMIAENNYWIERRDLCFDDGELIQWEPYEEKE